MPLLGKAAMLLSFDIAPEAISEHDEWHTHEHLPERLAIAGFLRGTRWVALHDGPRYFVLYEVKDLDTLASDAYLARLNHPTPWTTKMMPYYRGMTRGLCSVVGSSGFGMGHIGLLCRFKAREAAESRLANWLCDAVLPQLPERAGLGSVHLLRAALTPKMTNEQRIRGLDEGVDWALLATAYDQGALEALAQGDLCNEQLEAHGATDIQAAMYRAGYTLTAGEL
jgi:hypothetical protein